MPLYTLELDHFKSFRGKQKIGPFSQFTSIIGPNGSGKSNLLEAICYVLGEKRTQLRAQKSSGLIYRDGRGQHPVEKASVTMLFSDDDRELTFQRISRVSSEASVYKFNGEAVPRQRYEKKLEEIGVYTKLHNFVMYQNTVERYVLRSEKQRTVLFEEMSCSIEKKHEYDEAKAALAAAETEVVDLKHKRNEVNSDKKTASKEAEEALVYEKEKGDLVTLRKRRVLFQLYHAEQTADEASERLAAGRAEETGSKAACEELRGTWRSAHEEVKAVNSQITAAEKAVAKAEGKVQAANGKLMKEKVGERHKKSRWEDTKRALAREKTKAASRAEAVASLEAQLAALAEQLTAEDSQDLTQGGTLDESQLGEYEALKEQAALQTGSLKDKAEAAKREAAAITFECDNLRRKKEDAEAKVVRLEKELAELSEEREARTAAADRDAAARDELTAAAAATAGDCAAAEEDYIAVNTDLERVVKSLGARELDEREEESLRRRAEVVQLLQSHFPGRVHGRLFDLIQERDKRYQLAIYKVISKYFDNIVVDTMDTAKECVRFLSAAKKQREEFIPINTIKEKSVDQRLRNIDRPEDVVLLCNVIDFKKEHAFMKKVLSFACGAVLVCPNSNTALAVSKGNFSSGQHGKTYSAVALDGTYYEKSGVISGGRSELEKKARKKFDVERSANATAKLKREKDALRERLRHVEARRRAAHALPEMRHRAEAARARADAGMRKLAALEKDTARLTAACPCQEETGETVTPFAPTADVAAGTCTDGYGHLLGTSPAAFSFVMFHADGSRKTMGCPPGTSFLLVNAAGAPVCDCVFLDAANVRTQQKPACNLFLPFNSATGFSDMTVHNNWLDNLGLTKVTLATGGAAGTSQAASFNGAAHLEVPALKTQDFRGDISICFFARCAGAACQSGGILSNAASTNGGWSIRTAMSPDRTLNLDLATVFPQASASLATSIASVDAFFHVCEVYGSDTFTLYVNGAEVASTPLTGDVAIKHCPFAIGADQRFGFFAGEIDEVLICDHVLGDADRALHQAANYAGMIAENMIRPCADNTLGCYA